MATEFETQTCSRCGGGGHYSYCQMYGTTCFKCRGKGKVYSKRGEAALAYARSLRTIPASEVTVGSLFWVDASPMGMGPKAGWYPVLSIGSDGSRYQVNGEWISYIMIQTEGQGYGACPDSPVQCVPNRERLAEIKTLALAYQDTLTAQGKPAKRKTKAA